jgi:predicted permease
MTAYRRLQRLLPPSFRERNGEAMAETFETRLEATRGRGSMAVLALWAREAMDLARTAVRLRASGRRRRDPEAPGPEPRRVAKPSRGSVTGFLEDLATDVRVALRGLVRQPVFAVASVGTLALGIGGVTALWSMVYAVLLKPLPYWESPELIRVGYKLGVVAGDPWPSPVPYDVFQAWSERGRTVEELASIRVVGRTVEMERAERLPVALVSTNLLDMIGVKPVLGRMLLPEDGEGGTGTGLGSPVVLLSHAFWTSAYGRDPTVVGRSLLVAGQPWAGQGSVPHTIVGVLPPDLAWFDRPGLLAEQPELWVPRAHVLPSALAGAEWYWEADREVIARLKPGSSAPDVASDLGAIRKELLSAPAPEIPPEAFVDVAPVAAMAIGSLRDRVLLPFAAALLVLVLACLNVANLLLGRLPSRVGELSMRGALGAARSRLGRQLGTEALVLAGLAAAAGAALAAVAVWVTGAWAPPELVLLRSAKLDLVALGFCIALATAAALAFGLAPALTGSRAVHLARLRPGGSVGARTLGLKLRPALLAGELAIALAVVGSAALLVRSFARVASVEMGFRPEGALVASMTLPREGYQLQIPPRTAGGASGFQWLPARLRLAEELVERLERDPRVAHAAVSVRAPLRGGWYVQSMPVRLEGSDRAVVSQTWNVVTPGWFDAVGLPLLSGRDFRESDRHDWPDVVPVPQGQAWQGVAIVNETLAARFWPGEDAIGKRLRYGARETLEVVGVVADDRSRSVVGIVSNDRSRSFTLEPLPTLYTPLAQEVMPRGELWNYSAELHVFVRAADERRNASLAPLVRDAVRELDSRVAVHDAEPMDDVLARERSIPRFSLWVLTAFGALAWVIAAAGVFGVLAYLVGQRTHEIGVRLALGGQPGDVVGLVVRQVAGLAVIGLAVGVWGALAAGKLLEGWLYEVGPTDPLSLSVAVALLLAAAVAAGWLPIRWAASVDPATTLRMDA